VWKRKKVGEGTQLSSKGGCVIHTNPLRVRHNVAGGIVDENGLTSAPNGGIMVSMIGHYRLWACPEHGKDRLCDSHPVFFFGA
jgi:hypothetical protein